MFLSNLHNSCAANTNSFAVFTKNYSVYVIKKLNTNLFNIEIFLIKHKLGRTNQSTFIIESELD